MAIFSSPIHAILVITLKTISRYLTPKYIFVSVWLSLLAVALWQLNKLNLEIAEYPNFIASKVAEFGVWAPLIFIALFAIRPLVFFPATILSLSAGALFGSTKAVFILLVAENISAFVSYSVGKYFGVQILSTLDKKSAFLKRFRTYFTNNGFVSILLLRLLYAPFDWLGYFAGATKIPYSAYATATCVGILPGLLTSAFLGGSLREPKNIAISAIFFMVGLVVSKVIKNHHKKETQHAHKDS